MEIIQPAVLITIKKVATLKVIIYINMNIFFVFAPQVA